jgi:Family of unknown function (DUF6312)
MDKLVRRITLIKRAGAKTETVQIYRSPGKRKRRKVSGWAAPFERGARKMLKANIALGQSALDRTNRANRRRRDGWMLDAPVIVFKAGRAGYNQARKAIPFGMLPKM